MGPLIAQELGFLASTSELMKFGSLPGVWTEDSEKLKKQILKSYSVIYLNEEIKAEALTKNIEGFTRFLYLLAAESSKFLELSKISSASAVPRQTTQRYFEILEDTLIVRRLNAFAKSEKRRLIQHPKFYFFDNGVLNSLLSNFTVSEDRKGQLFENLFVTQLLTTLSYSNLDYRVSNYRTDSGAEVDVILELDGDLLAIEVKAGHFRSSDLWGLRSFQNFVGKKVKSYVVIPEGTPRRIEDIEVLPWQEFLNLELFS